MRGALVATAALGVIAIGGFPVLALNLAADDPPAPAEPTARIDARDESVPGPPWAHGHGHGHGDERHHGKHAHKHAHKHAQKRVQQHPGTQAGRDPDKQSERRGGAGRGHGAEVSAWAHCLGDAARRLEPGERLDPVAECGPRPTPPGRRR